VSNCDNPSDPDHKLICPKLSGTSTICKTCEAWQEADRFWRRWLKGGILIDIWRRWRAAQPKPLNFKFADVKEAIAVAAYVEQMFAAEQQWIMNRLSWLALVQCDGNG
jgi:hypothetical protein